MQARELLLAHAASACRDVSASSRAVWPSFADMNNGVVMALLPSAAGFLIERHVKSGDNVPLRAHVHRSPIELNVLV